ncbi:MAG: GxxExxY protein [Treponema sp.]|nr:GxxExxY protein [Treponema sp.]
MGRIITTNTHESYQRYVHEQNEEKILYKDECYKIYRCIYAVNKKLGAGFLESVYQEALEIELRRECIPFTSQTELEILYDGFPLSSKFIADIICYDKIILELKAVSKINDQFKAQLINYLNATGYRLGLLINFNSYPKTEIVRMVR